jgi:hypothetical protein
MAANGTAIGQLRRQTRTVGCVDRLMIRHEGRKPGRILHQDATPRLLANLGSEIPDEGGIFVYLGQLAAADVIARELDHRTWFDISIGIDMMAQALRRRAKWLAVGAPIRINEHQRIFGAPIHKESAQAQDVVR